MHVIAHRGLRTKYPENTIASIEAALCVDGLHGVEFDVEISRDAVPVVLHQETMGVATETPPNSRKELTPASRNFTSRDWVSTYTAQELQEIDAGHWMDEKFRNIRIPLLSDVMQLHWAKKIAYVELKDPYYWGAPAQSNPERIVQAVLPYFAKYPGSLTCLSFNPQVLSKLHEKLPRVPKILALWTEWSGRAEEAIEKALQCHASGISLPDTLLLEEKMFLKYAHAQKLFVHVYPITPARGEVEFEQWTASSQHQRWRELQDAGVDAVVSDFAEETVDMFNATQKL